MPREIATTTIPATNDTDDDDDGKNTIGIVFMYANQLENIYIFGKFIMPRNYMQCFCLFYLLGVCFFFLFFGVSPNKNYAAQSYSA